MYRMVTYLINVDNCINMEYYDFLFYRAQADGEVLIYNVDSLKNSDKQIENLSLDIEERYFENGNDNYRILFCVPRKIPSKSEFVNNSNFVLTYKIFKCVSKYFRDVSKVYLFSFIYGSVDDFADFEVVNREIDNTFYSSAASLEFPDFSGATQHITADGYPEFTQKLQAKISDCKNANIREIFMHAWDKHGVKSIPADLDLSEKDFFESFAQGNLIKYTLPKQRIMHLHIDTDDSAGLKNQQIVNTLTFIDAVLNAERLDDETFVGYNLNLDEYADIISAYLHRLNCFKGESPTKKEFIYSYRDFDSMLKSYTDNYKSSNEAVYNAIKDTKPGYFSDTVKMLKGKNIKNDTVWDDTYGKIQTQTELADSNLTEYMNSMSHAFANAGRITETVCVNYFEIENEINKAELEFKKANEELFNAYKASDVDYQITLENKNKLTQLNRKIKNILRYEKFQRLLPFLLSLLFAVLSFIIPYSLGETHVFSSVRGVIIWSIENAAFAVLAALGSLAVFRYFGYKKKALFKKVINACDEYFKAYLRIAKQYEQKLNAISKVEQYSTRLEFLISAANGFKLYEQKLNYHKNRIEKLKKSLNYFGNFIKNSSGEFSAVGKYDDIDLDKDEIRNHFYYTD